jgi:Leucine-rich repeat (LRR) protein
MHYCRCFALIAGVIAFGFSSEIIGQLPNAQVSSKYSITENELGALHSLYYSTDGDNWKWRNQSIFGPKWSFNYSFQQDPCADDSVDGTPASWQGVTCNNPAAMCFSGSFNCSVTELELSEFNLVGTLPDDLTLLFNLNTLWVQNNPMLVGSIPREIGDLSNLFQMSLYQNRLGGSIPTSIGKLTGLLKAYLNGNRLEGTLPSELGELSNLFALYVGENNLEGSIPSQITRLTYITELSLCHNRLTGTIPQSIGDMTLLVSLDFSSNSLKGSLPASIGRLKTLQELNLDSNSISGSLPSEIGGLRDLEVLYLSSNRLYDELPTALGFMKSLSVINLGFNKFSGRIPSQIAFLTNAQILDLRENRLNGTLPASIGQMSSLEQFTISTNYLRGSIPSEFGQLSKLKTCRMYSNLLSGSIPSDIGRLKSINYLDFTGNSLSGSIPPELGLLSKMQGLIIINNRISGTLPPDLGRIPALVSLELGGNRIRGSIPSAFGALRSLELFGVAENMLTGSIPSQLSSIELLENFDVSFNSLDGTLPSSIGNLEKLSILVLNDNKIVGSLPTEWGTLDQLTVLFLSNNRITGPIPSTWGRMSSLDGLYLSGNSLSGSIPSQLGQLPLSVLYLFNNRLSGSLTAWIGQLQSVSAFDLNGNALTGSIPSELGEMISLVGFDVSSNKLSGRLPETSFGKMENLKVFRAQSNRLTGSLPISIFSARNLSTIQLQGNSLTGELSILASDAPNSFIETIDISDNAFTGTLPNNVFLLPKLAQFAASGNCFRGELPDSLCSALELVVLAMNGASSGSKCSSQMGFFSSRRSLMEGSIPDCVYYIGSIQAISLSGNGLFGSLPERHASSRLQQISLSHNHITGSIPSEYLDPALLDIDLSYNRISGDIRAYRFQNNVSEKKNKLILNVNRLSGHISREIRTLSDVNILSGNVFQCSGSSDLPEGDPYVHSTVCGAEDLDKSNYVLVASTAILALVFMASLSFLRIATFHERLGNFCGLAYKHLCNAKALKGKLEADPEKSYVPLVVFFSRIEDIATVCVILGVYSVIVGTPIYAGFKSVSTYSTHLFQYSWIVTAAMISGVVPASVIIILWVTAVSLFYWKIVLRTKISVVDIKSRSSPERDDALSSAISLLSEDGLYASCYLMSNVIVTGCTNALYVYSIVGKFSSLTLFLFQIVLVVTELGWKEIMTSILSIGPLSKWSVQRKTFLLSFAYILNSIVLPCLAFMVINPSCFLELLVPPEDVTATYVIQECNIYASTLQYGVYCPIQAIVSKAYTVTYSPIFVYNFQCASSILRTFAPVMVIKYSISSISAVVLMCFALNDMNWKAYLGSIIRRLMNWSNLWHSSNVDNDSELKWRSTLRPYEVLSVLYQQSVAMMTFGILCPFVAIAIAVASVITSVKCRVFVSISHVYRLQESKEAGNGILHAAVKSCGSANFALNGSLWVLITLTSGIFVGLFLVDISADDLNVSWTSAILFFVAAVVFVIVTWLHSIFRFGLLRVATGSQTDVQLDSESNPLGRYDDKMYGGAETQRYTELIVRPSSGINDRSSIIVSA